MVKLATSRTQSSVSKAKTAEKRRYTAFRAELKQRQFGTNVKINLVTTFVTNIMICNKCNDEVIVLAVCSGGVLQEV